MPESSNNHEIFVDTVHKFITDLNRYYPNDGCTKLLEMFSNLDMSKILVRFIKLIGKYEQQIKDKDDTMFSTPCVPFPEVQLHEVWTHLNSGQKRKVYNYLHMLLFIGKLIIQQESAVVSTNNGGGSGGVVEAVDSTPNVSTPSDNKLQFNPYEGVGTTNTPFSVDELYSNMDCLMTDEQKNGSSSFGLGSLSKLVGMDNLLNMDDLTSQLNNITDEDIDEANQNIQKMMGGNCNDPKSSKMLTEMLSSIKKELNNEKESNNMSKNPIESIVKIAKTVAENIKPKIEEDNIDIGDLFGGLNKGGDTGEDMQNPFNMLNKMMGNLSNIKEGGELDPNMDPMNLITQMMGSMANSKGGPGGGMPNILGQMMGVLNNQKPNQNKKKKNKNKLL